MASANEERSKLMWKPKLDRSTNIHEFQSLVNHAFGLNLSEYINNFRFDLKMFRLRFYWCFFFTCKGTQKYHCSGVTISRVSRTTEFMLIWTTFRCSLTLLNLRVFSCVTVKLVILRILKMRKKRSLVYLFSIFWNQFLPLSHTSRHTPSNSFKIIVQDLLRWHVEDHFTHNYRKDCRMSLLLS